MKVNVSPCILMIQSVIMAAMVRVQDFSPPFVVYLAASWSATLTRTGLQVGGQGRGQNPAAAAAAVCALILISQSQL